MPCRISFSSFGSRTRSGFVAFVAIAGFIAFSSSIFCSKSALSYLSWSSYCLAANSSCFRHFSCSPFDATSSKYFRKCVISISLHRFFAQFQGPKLLHLQVIRLSRVYSVRLRVLILRSTLRPWLKHLYAFRFSQEYPCRKCLLFCFVLFTVSVNSCIFPFSFSPIVRSRFFYAKFRQEVPLCRECG